MYYLLQTDPSYLARLMFAMPQCKTNKFLESVILTLYNFGGNAREEFLLLQLFKTALVEEVSVSMFLTLPLALHSGDYQSREDQ